MKCLSRVPRFKSLERNKKVYRGGKRLVATIDMIEINIHEMDDTRRWAKDDKNKIESKRFIIQFFKINMNRSLKINLLEQTCFPNGYFRE